MQQKRGFTIVELLIVVVVIAILAAITIVAYNGIQNQATTSSLKSDLSNAARAMEVAKIESNTDTYPIALPSSVRASSNIGLSLSIAGANSFCINAHTLSGNQQRFHITPSGIQNDTCPGAVIPQTEVGMAQNLVLDTGFANTSVASGNWYLSRSSGSVAASNRDGTTGDPYPNRKVLRISNTATAGTSWSYMPGPINYAGIEAGKSYTTRYWVRLASGTYASVAHHPGVQHGAATNTSIPVANGSASITASWQEITRTVIATANGISGNVHYLGLNPTVISNNTFVLEYQGFEIYEN